MKNYLIGKVHFVAMMMSGLVMIGLFQNCGQGFKAQDFIISSFSASPPPQVVLSVRPSAFSNSRSTDISFDVPSNFISVECSVDGAAYTNCRNGLQLTNLSDGNHQVLVRATDSTNTVTELEPINFQVDTTPPTLTGTRVPVTGLLVTQTGASVLQFTGTDSGSGIERYNCSINGTVSECAPPYSVANLTNQYSTISVTAVDRAGNVSAPYRYEFEVSLPMTETFAQPNTFANTQTGYTALAADGNRLAVTEFAESTAAATVSLYDITNPVQPTLLASNIPYTTNGASISMEFKQNKLYLSTGTQTVLVENGPIMSPKEVGVRFLDVVDVSNPQSPVRSRWTAPNGIGFSHICINPRNSLQIAMAFGNSFGIVDFTNFSTPQMIAQVNVNTPLPETTVWDTFQMSCSWGNDVLVLRNARLSSTGRTDGVLEIYDMTNVSQPRFTTNLVIPADHATVQPSFGYFVSDSNLYIYDHHHSSTDPLSRLMVYSLADKSNPTLMSFVRFESHSTFSNGNFPLFIDGNRMYSRNTDVFDISNLSAIRRVGAIGLNPAYIVKNGYAYTKRIGQRDLVVYSVR